MEHERSLLNNSLVENVSAVLSALLFPSLHCVCVCVYVCVCVC